MPVEINFKMNSSSRRALLAVIGIIASVGLYRWILWPYSSQLFAAYRYQAALDKSIQQTDSLSRQIQEKKDSIEQMLKETDRLRNELFTVEEARAFFASLAAIGSQVGCAIQSVAQPSNQSNNGEQGDVKSAVVGKKATVTIVGGYNDIVRFLNKISCWQRKVWIDSVSIDTGSGTGKLKCQANFTLYCIEPMESN
jgi:Tfp pilus assembly protein PilO